MKTIEDLKVEKTFYKREKDVFGNVTRTPYQKEVPRKPVTVSPGVRFGYFFIDMILIYILQTLITLILGFILVAVETQSISTLMTLKLVGTLLGYAGFFFFYSVFETYAGGSPGKLICGYTVIDKYAEGLSFPTAMLRSICRFVPFEAFSCISERGWHDKWSNTYVVRKSEKEELRKLLGKIDHNLGIID